MKGPAVDAGPFGVWWEDSLIRTGGTPVPPIFRNFAKQPCAPCAPCAPYLLKNMFQLTMDIKLRVVILNPIKPKKRKNPMASEILKLTTEIVVSHTSMTELTPEQLVDEIKAVYNVLASLEGGATLEERLAW